MGRRRHSGSRRDGQARALTAARLVWGASLVLGPGRLIAAVGGDDVERSRTVARILGGRQLLEGAFELRASPGRLAIGVCVDLAHAATAVGLAAADRRWRRVAAIDASLAGMFAAWGWRRYRQIRAVPPALTS